MPQLANINKIFVLILLFFAKRKRKSIVQNNRNQTRVLLGNCKLTFEYREILNSSEIINKTDWTDILFWRRPNIYSRAKRKIKNQHVTQSK